MATSGLTSLYARFVYATILSDEARQTLAWIEALDGR
jgi:hypothetical protein